MPKAGEIPIRILTLLSAKRTIDNKPWNLTTGTIVIVWMSKVMEMSDPDIITFLRGRKIENITPVDLSRRIRHSLKVIRGFGSTDPKHHDPIVGEILTAVFGPYAPKTITRKTSSSEIGFTFPKTCPRCSNPNFSGKMMLDEDYYGQSATCFNCGFVIYQVSTPISTKEEISNRPVHAKTRLD